MFTRMLTAVPLGSVTVTEGAREALARSGEDVAEFIARHAAGDWGDVEPEDAYENEIALQYGLRVTSLYATALNYRVLVVTEGDRTCTHVTTADGN